MFCQTISGYELTKNQ